MSLGFHGEQNNRLKRYVHIQKKTWSQPVTRFTSYGLRIARLVETSNAESPTMIYIADTPEQLPITHTDIGLVQDAMYIHPTGRPRCFVFD